MRLIQATFGVLVGIGMTAAMVDPAAAQVRPTRQVKPPEVVITGEGPQLFGAFTLMTDNRAQGFTSTREDPSVALDLGVLYKSFYFGVTADRVDFGSTVNFNGQTVEIADLGLTYYAGVFKTYNGIDIDFGVSYATFPDAFDGGFDLNYFEAFAGFMVPLWGNVRGGGRIYYSPEFSGETGQNWVFEGTVEKPLGTIFGRYLVTYTSVVGYQAGDEGDGGFDYWFVQSGVRIDLKKHLALDVVYHDAFDVPFACAGLCDEAVVVSLTLSF